MRFTSLFISLFFSLFLLQSCSEVDPGHKGVLVEWSQTNQDKVLDEGLHMGVSYFIGTDVVAVDVRERTTIVKTVFNDKDGMSLPVEFAVDWSPQPANVNKQYAEIKDLDAKVLKTIKSAGAKVVPQYGGVELNTTYRAEAQVKVEKLLQEEFPQFYNDVSRVEITDIDLPASMADQAQKLATQLAANETAKAKEAEAKAKGAAIVATSKANFEAAQWDAKAAKEKSTPAQIKLIEAQAKLERAKNGTSEYGSNNVFGEGVTSLKILGNGN